MLNRWDPFREMMVLRNSMDRSAARELTVAPSDWKSFNWSIALDVVENEDQYQVKASLPGIDPEDLEITFEDKRLTIKGEVKEEDEINEPHYHLRERRYGNFTRTIKLPSGIASDKIEAHYDKGVLTLHLPKVEEAKPKKITIKTSSPEMIDAESTEVTKED